jgi:hypothetical protein
MRWSAVPLLLIAVALAGACPGAAAGSRAIVQTKMRAEVNVLHAVAHQWKKWRKYGLVDPRTHLPTDNTEAVCHGRGKRHRGNRYHRFVCVVRPHMHHGRQGVWVSYRAFAKKHYRIRILAFHRW